MTQTKATEEFKSAAGMIRQGFETDVDYEVAYKLVKTMATTKCSAILIDMYSDPKLSKIDIRISTVAELRNLRSKNDAKEETVLNVALMKRVRLALQGKYFFFMRCVI